ncbi:MAG TPA: tRNA (adenosine(37)-N6)-threonylcarbamoyltransferase complex ATPase subunit type 1 TsaE [Candidatus Synoicihabitans sp.]|nr:tRNA (adenosine(37)-N6)-threonylcarbamoyltransferase complex ATPase subunit type 1 TsaE [Candidatus Synoicihabitans sp.]
MATSISARLRAGVATTTAEEMKRLARGWAMELPGDTTLALHGDLGAGKTTFVQGLAEGLGVKERVTSPTFTLFNVHRGTHVTLVHFDAYRLGDSAQVEALMIEDFLASPWILAVEWPEKVAAWLPPKAWHLDLAITDNQRHTIRLRG